MSDKEKMIAAAADWVCDNVTYSLILLYSDQHSNPSIDRNQALKESLIDFIKADPALNGDKLIIKSRHRKPEGLLREAAYKAGITHMASFPSNTTLFLDTINNVFSIQEFGRVKQIYPEVA